MVSALADKWSELLRREHWWAEFWSAAVAISWGMQNAVDPSALGDVESYRLLTKLMPELLLEGIAIVVGFIQLWALIFAHRSIARGAAGMLASIAYSFCLISFFMAPAIPPGWVFCAGWVGINVFAIARSAKGLR